MPCGESYVESRMRENRTYGSERGREYHTVVLTPTSMDFMRETLYRGMILLLS